MGFHWASRHWQTFSESITGQFPDPRRNSANTLLPLPAKFPGNGGSGERGVIVIPTSQSPKTRHSTFLPSLENEERTGSLTTSSLARRSRFHFSPRRPLNMDLSLPNGQFEERQVERYVRLPSNQIQLSLAFCQLPNDGRARGPFGISLGIPTLADFLRVNHWAVPRPPTEQCRHALSGCRRSLLGMEGAGKEV